MATVYVADRYSDEVRIVDTSAGDWSQPFAVTLPQAAALIINDTIKLCSIPVGCVVLEWWLDCPILDSGADTIRIQLGDNTSASRFMAATGGFNAAKVVTNLLNGVAQILPRGYTAADNFIATVSTAPNTSAVTGTIKGMVRFQRLGIAAGV